MCEIQPREVLDYLNELGYRNISAKQLKDFIYDLKKLIKYDSYTELDIDKPDHNLPDNYNVFDALYSTGTISSNSKNVRSKESIVTVQVVKPKIINLKSAKCPHDISNRSSRSTNNSSNIPHSAKTCDTHCSTSRSTENYEETQSSARKQSSCKDKENTRPRSAFIKVKPSVLKPNKSDPVALYHYYQDQWKNHKIPGQEHHADLRWAMREKLLGDFNQIPQYESLHANRKLRNPNTK